MRTLYLAACLAVGMLVIVEAALRWGVGLGDPPLAVLDAETEYRLKPSAAYRRWGNAIAINRYGMRSEDHAETPSELEKRVLVIGDSVVYGNHFLDQSETIAARMTERLRGIWPASKCKPLVMAMAASSWGPVNQLRFLERHGTLGASLAVIAVSAHDLYDTPTFRPDILPYRLAPPTTAISDAIQSVLERIFRSEEPSRDLDAERERSLAAFVGMLDKLQASGVRTFIYYHPTLTELARGPAPEAAVFGQVATDRSIPVIDGLLTLRAGTGYRDDIHPNADGARAIAERLAKEVSPWPTDCKRGE